MQLKIQKFSGSGLEVCVGCFWLILEMYLIAQILLNPFNHPPSTVTN